MKHIKVVAICFLSVFICYLFGGCFQIEKSYENYRYSIFDSGETKCVEITGLTEEGEQKEVLIIPQSINGMKVRAIQKRKLIMGVFASEWVSSELKKVYFYYTVDIQKNTFDNCPNIKSTFIIHTNGSDDIFGSDSIVGINNTPTYIFSNVYFEFYKNKHKFLFPANVTYYYNFENADNCGCFWLDNIQPGERIIHLPPVEPIREGYVFDGWYKEPECINLWNFEKDIMPSREEKFFELKLYAKWN